MRWAVNVKLRLLYPRERPGTHCIGGWVGLRTSSEGAENLIPSGIRSPDHPVRRESAIGVDGKIILKWISKIKGDLLMGFD